MEHIDAVSLIMFIITLIDSVTGITKTSESWLLEQVTDTALPSLFASSSATLPLSEIIPWPLFCNMEAVVLCISLSVPQT